MAPRAPQKQITAEAQQKGLQRMRPAVMTKSIM
jgi:hypothetical protein